LLNRTGEKTDISVRLSDLGIVGEARARDLWRRKDIGQHKETFTTVVDAHDAAMIKFTAEAPLAALPDCSDPVPPEGRTFEIEDDGNIIQGGRVDAYHWGFSGKGHAVGSRNVWRTFNPTWMVEVGQDGLYKLEIRYVNGLDHPIPAGVSTSGLGTDGKELNFPPTKTWADWQTVTLTLRMWKGWNRVNLDVRDARNNDLALDWLKVTPVK
jgi:hypothetical protein